MFKKGVITGMPIFLGYFPIAIAFGLLAKTQHISLTQTMLFSLLVFAGASQFIALKLIGIGATPYDIGIVTFLVNLRHMLMSASLASKLEDKRWIPLISFGITDETFSIASTRKEPITSTYLLGLETISYISWVGGSITGFLIGDVLPKTLGDSMSITLYAMFIAILIPEIKKSFQVLVVSSLGAGMNVVLWFTHMINPGIAIVFSIIFGAGLGVLLFGEDVK